MTRYRRKPTEVDAWQWLGADTPGKPDWIRELEARGTILLGAQQLRFSTPAGLVYANHSDWIIRNEWGGFEIEAAAAFEQRYEATGG
ncbi:MAG: hypothetical protein ACOY4R_27700 [Pseudomonadota bacterium]